MKAKTSMRRTVFSLVIAVATAALGGMVSTTATGCDAQAIETTAIEEGPDVVAKQILANLD